MPSVNKRQKDDKYENTALTSNEKHRKLKMQQLMHHTKEGEYICIWYVAWKIRPPNKSKMKSILLTVML